MSKPDGTELFERLDAVKGISLSRLRELAEAEKRELIYILPDCKTCANKEDNRTCALCVGKTIDYQSSFYEPLANKTRCARERERNRWKSKS